MTEAMVVACKRYSGDAQVVSKTFLDVAEWLKHREMAMAPWIGVYDDGRDPESYVDPETRQMHGEVWIPFSGEARGDATVEVRRIEPQRVAAAIHRGDTSHVGETVRALKRWVRSQGLRPAPCHRQIYLKAVPGRPDESQTEVQVPLKS
ncbi:MAG TPA: GyrI-like domain-containing protein [Candidatus Polarisedimenticolia bacterium]|nr:GyrI-like domain-containing protein [Candidatus Polarisedimenticolia bacterium]